MPVDLDTDTIENRIERLRRKTRLDEVTLAQLAADPERLLFVEKHERMHEKVAEQDALDPSWKYSGLHINDPMGGTRMNDAFSSIFETTAESKSEVVRETAKERGVPVVDVGLVDPDALSPQDVYGYMLKHADEAPDTSIEAAIGVMEEHVRRTGDGHHRLAAMKATAARRLGQ